MALELVTLPCLADNYAYLIHDPATGATGVVDVPDAAPILAELSRREWVLSDIFLTHHHDDHIAGVKALRAATGAKVWGAAADRHRLPPLDVALAEGDDLMSLAAISKRQDISLPYLEQLFVKLRRAGLVEAVRGPGGGYKLARSPDAIRISDVMEAVEENVDALHTGAGVSGGVSGTRAQSLTNRLWEGLSAHVYVFLHQTRLSDVIGNQMTPCPAVPALFRVVDEE